MRVSSASKKAASPAATKARPPGAQGGAGGGAAATGRPTQRRGSNARTGRAGDARSTGSGTRNRRPPIPALVIGPVSPLARVAGVAGTLAAVLLLVTPAYPLVRTAGPLGGDVEPLGAAHNAWDFVVPLPAAVVLGCAGVLCVLRQLPRFGLAVLAASGAVGLGELVRTAFLAQTRQRLGLDLPLPEGQTRVFQYVAGPGLWLQLGSGALLVLAGMLAVLAWRRTEMEDDGSFDPLRPLFAGLSAVVAMLAMGGVVLAAADPVGDTGATLSVDQRLGLSQLGLQLASPDLPLSASSAAATALADRPALDQLGGLLVAVAAALSIVLAATLRPRLATVGMYAGLAALLASSAFGVFLLVIRSTALSVGAGAVLLALAAAGCALLALAAGRTTRRGSSGPG
ncbi:MAG TPA: hypothetical protein VLJ59_04370 [Mycobacteriales bacterium]|nr:hypothetical protein [Mycobacteriales bacterium]